MSSSDPLVVPQGVGMDLPLIWFGHVEHMARVLGLAVAPRFVLGSTRQVALLAALVQYAPAVMLPLSITSGQRTDVVDFSSFRPGLAHIVVCQDTSERAAKPRAPVTLGCSVGGSDRITASQTCPSDDLSVLYWKGINEFLSDTARVLDLP